MSKIVAFLMILLFAPAVGAQDPVYVPPTYEFRLLTATRTQESFAIPNGLTVHSITVIPRGGVTGVTITVAASTDGTNYATVGTLSNMGTATFFGTYVMGRVTLSGLTASSPVYDATYSGRPPVNRANQGVPGGAVVYTTGFNSGITAVTSGSTTTLTTTTTAVQSIWCNNQTGLGVTLYITDGNDVYYVGPGYSFAANNNGTLLNISTGLVFTNGIKMSAGTASAVKCQVMGLQP